MKRLLLLLPLLILGGCKYSSMREAQSSCNKWELDPPVNAKHHRLCLNERDTRQVMGIERPHRMDVRGGVLVPAEGKIVKRFRY